MNLQTTRMYSLDHNFGEATAPYNLFPTSTIHMSHNNIKLCKV